jgi:microcystin-dependent protein
MMDPFVGEIAIFAGNFAPEGWFFCDGSILPIAQYQVLYAVIGATYGGDGSTTFALPDLRGRVPVGFGYGTPYPLAQKGGSESTTLTLAQLPAHSHLLNASNLAADQAAPTGNVLAAEPTGSSAIYHPMPTDATQKTTLNPGAIGMAGGGGLPIDNRQPYLALNYIIAWQGIFPQHP